MIIINSTNVSVLYFKIIDRSRHSHSCFSHWDRQIYDKHFICVSSVHNAHKLPVISKSTLIFTIVLTFPGCISILQVRISPVQDRGSQSHIFQSMYISFQRLVRTENALGEIVKEVVQGLRDDLERERNVIFFTKRSKKKSKIKQFEKNTSEFIFGFLNNVFRTSGIYERSTRISRK